MYCYIPKNACSRFKPLLRKREGFADWADAHKIHGKNGLQRLQWLSRKLAIERLSDTAVRKFVVVRDPFSRLVSAYQNKLASPWPDQRADFWNKHLRQECPSLIASTPMPSQGPLMSLESFLHCLLSNDNTQPSNEHWRPQTELCALDHIQYNYYLHLETLADDAHALLQNLNWHENLTAFQIHRSPVYSRNLSDFFSDRALQLALQYYKRDFELLPYQTVPAGTIHFYSVFNGTNFQPGFVPPVDFQAPQTDHPSDTRPTEHFPPPPPPS
ncbi:Carbohydrate sulfotransferase 11 [Gracilariopsis chorda]|uniref:Carbohydrate sulfotransferase 11 n=1 Tax=Gracilariopsis chorda TaxID=448386 RepID=A0A2V3J539_9FLOR|nr:Carbohydrate sulfotransferase 11 [Gracilariopsis chorda]|eukprot:PXF48490.1 Carbohydrate sulfotransferase 11 [Gracilariopsis chorda]